MWCGCGYGCGFEKRCGFGKRCGYGAGAGAGAVMVRVKFFAHFGQWKKSQKTFLKKLFFFFSTLRVFLFVKINKMSSFY